MRYSLVVVGTPKRHHYVPRFLLKPWCTSDETEGERLWACFRLPKLHGQPRGRLHDQRYTPVSTGYVKHLYTLRPPLPGVETGDPYGVEKGYSRLENEAAAVRDQFLAGVAPSELSEEERRSWAEFVATLEARTPRSIREVEATGSRLRRRLRREHRAYFANPVEADRLFERFEFDAMLGNATRATPQGESGKAGRRVAELAVVLRQDHGGSSW